MRSHKKSKEFPCEVPGCGQVFKIPMTLVNHMRSRHEEDIEKPLEEKPLEQSILHNPEIAKILEAKLPVPKDMDVIEKPEDGVISEDDNVIYVDDQSTVVDDDATVVDDDANVVDDDATVVDDDVTLLTS
jgi:hypothetical protein